MTVDFGTKWVHVADGPLHACSAARKIPANFSTSTRREETPKGSIFILLLSKSQDSQILGVLCLVCCVVWK